MHHQCTFHGLHDWSSRMFEKLGWMVLAARDGRREPVRGYLSGLRHLADKIRSKHKETVDPDRRRDLEELLDNVVYLHEKAYVLLKP